jgi:hypothetical protein
VGTLIRIYFSRFEQSSFVQFASVRVFGIKFTPVSSVIPLAKLGAPIVVKTWSIRSGQIVISNGQDLRYELRSIGADESLFYAER